MAFLFSHLQICSFQGISPETSFTGKGYALNPHPIYFLCFGCFQTGSLQYVALAVLELALYTRLACLCLPSAGIKGVCHDLASSLCNPFWGGETGFFCVSLAVLELIISCKASLGPPYTLWERVMEGWKKKKGFLAAF